MSKIIHISDLHFGKEDPEIARALLGDIQNLSPDIVVISGDLTQRARSGQYQRAADFLDQLKFPKLVVPGNHDIALFNLFYRFARPLRRFRKYFGDEMNPVWTNSDMVIVGINTARSLTWKGGRISIEQIELVKKNICNAPDDMLKVITVHHNLFPLPGTPSGERLGAVKIIFAAS